MAFTSIPNEAIDRMTELSAGAWRLYCVLARYRNHKTGKCYPSVSTLSQVMKIDRRHVFRLRSELAQLGWARFDGSNVTELLGFDGDIFVTPISAEIVTDIKVTAAKNVTRKSQKCHPVVAKMSVAYKEEQDEITILKNNTNTPVAIAPGSISRQDCYALFVELRSSVGEYEAPYERQTKDFVRLDALYKNCERTNWPLTREKFTQAVMHYFATPQKVHTLADLASRFSEFYKSAFDKFGKPVANGNGAMADMSDAGRASVVAGQAWLKQKQEEFERTGKV